MHTTTTFDVETLNSLLRGETSAVETYDQAIEKFETDPIVADLRRIRDEHQQAVGILYNHVLKYGGTPSSDSGAWGTFAAAVTGAAKALGPQTALAALKQGELHGIQEYQNALEKANLAEECRLIIRSELLVRCDQHVATLERLITRLENK